MNEITEHQEAQIKSTSEAMLKTVLPYLSQADQGAHVKGLLADDLYRHEVTSTRSKSDITTTIVIFAGALIAGVAVGIGLS